LLLARIISGFGSANISAAQAYIADISDAKDRAKKMGIIGAAFGLGFVFGPPLGGWLYSAGSHSTYGGMMFVGLFTALLCVLNFVLAFVLLPESNTQMGGVRRKPIDTFKGMAKAWNIEIIGELLLINFIYITAFSMMQINAAVLWKEHYSLSPKAIGNIFGVIGVFSAIVQGGLIGFFQKKIGAPMY
jgi:MFS family permease